MEPEVLIGIVAVFVSGCAVGAGATLVGFWARRGLSRQTRTPLPLEPDDAAMLHHDMGELISSVQELHERLDFHERVLAGSGARKDPNHPGREGAPGA